MSFTGKWRLLSVENGEAYQKAIHTPEAHLAKLKALHADLKSNPDLYIEELTVDKAGGKVQRVAYIRGEKRRDSGLIGFNQEVTHDTADGRTVTGKIIQEGDNKLVIHEKGPDFEAHITLELHGDEIHANLTSGGVTCKEVYTRV
jgi:hypothetical protein